MPGRGLRCFVAGREVVGGLCCASGWRFTPHAGSLSLSVQLLGNKDWMEENNVELSAAVLDVLGARQAEAKTGG